MINKLHATIRFYSNVFSLIKKHVNRKFLLLKKIAKKNHTTPLTLWLKKQQILL